VTGGFLAVRASGTFIGLTIKFENMIRNRLLVAFLPAIGFGVTPAAVAGMTAVTRHRGLSPNAFVILPLVARFSHSEGIGNRS
jgi:Na+/glutamate symporter